MLRDKHTGRRCNLIKRLEAFSLHTNEKRTKEFKGDVVRGRSGAGAIRTCFCIPGHIVEGGAGPGGLFPVLEPR